MVISHLRSTVIVIVAVLVLLTFLFVGTQTIDLEEHYRFSSDLRRLKALDATLNQDILKSRYALLPHYDPLVTELAALRRVQEGLEEVPGFLGQSGQMEIRRILETHAAAVTHKERLVERFKSQNAVLKNSLDYLPIATTELADDAASRIKDRELATRVRDILREVLLYNLTASEELAPSINAQIETLLSDRGRYSAAVGGPDLDIVVAHVKTILDYKPRVDALTEELISSPIPQLVSELDSAYDRCYEQALETANAYRMLLYLVAVILLGGIVYAIVELKNATAAKERIESELRVARDIQMGILPKKFPTFSGTREFEIYAAIEPAREVGGDFYDAFLVADNDHLCFLVGDVSGKGVPAALFMAMSKTLIQATAKEGIPPDEILDRVNKELCLDKDSKMFVTIFCGIVNARTGEMTYSNGGHTRPYLLRGNGRVEALEAVGGMVLGVMEGTVYQARSMVLHGGEGLFLYTDGVTEAMSRDDDQFSEQRLEEFLQRSDRSPLEELTQGAMDEVKSFSVGVPQSDDITILTLRYVVR